jgi:DNA-directed RNA polymerase subunit RPC12/RpoP
MVVRCSQCGAKIQRKDEGRFFACPFCRSSLVLEGERTFGCFVMEHQRNDLWPKALFRERLAEGSGGRTAGAITVDFVYVPFWVVRRKDGTIYGCPAAKSAHGDIHSIKIPPGRLVFVEEALYERLPVVTPSISLEAALGDRNDEGLGRVDLVYLPIYFMYTVVSRLSLFAFVVADSVALYCDIPPRARDRISARPLIFFVGTAVLLTVVGLAFDTVLARAVGIGAAALLLFAVSPLAIGRQR